MLSAWLNRLFLVVLAVFLLVLPQIHVGWLVGKMGLICLNGLLTSGTMCGWRLVILQLVFYFRSKGMLKDVMRCAVKRRHQHLLRSKLVRTFSGLSCVHSISPGINRNCRVPIVDRVCGEKCIANLFASKLSSRLNTHSGLSADALNLGSSFLDGQLAEVMVSAEDVLSALESLKPGKTDFDRVSTNHLNILFQLLLSILPLSLQLFFAMAILCPSVSGPGLCVDSHTKRL